MKILLSDYSTLAQNNDLDITVFEQYGDVVYNKNISRDELLATAHEYDMILCNKTIIDKTVIEKAKKLILEEANKDEAVLKEKDIAVVVTELAPSQVTIALRVWCKTEDYWGVYSRLMENVKKSLDDSGVEIPFNQLQVHIKND